MTAGERPTSLPAGGPNALSHALDLLGDEWGVLVLQRALLGAARYSEFLDQLPISHAVLTSRLHTLSREGLLTERAYQRNPVRVEYLLTARGRSVWPVLLAIWDWERQWGGHLDALPTPVHTLCGHEFRPVLTCDSCEKPVQPRDVSTRWGPSGSWARSSPRAGTRRRSARRTEPQLFPETMALVGNRWSSALIGAAFRGVRRFADFQDALGAPPSVVAERLRIFTEQGILARSAEAGEAAGYRLTDKGRAFFPVIMVLVTWAQRWYRADEGPALVHVHTECTDEFLAVLSCDHCCQRLRGADVLPTSSAGGDPSDERMDR